MAWTEFFDMSSGGRNKQPWNHIYIEAPKNHAKIIFYNIFGTNPDRVSCTCCGSDYSITEYEDLNQATAYNRNCDYDNKTNKYIEQTISEGYRSGKYQTLGQYLKDNEKIKVIYYSEVKEEEKFGEVPEQGYVWQ